METECLQVDEGLSVRLQMKGSRPHLYLVECDALVQNRFPGFREISLSQRLRGLKALVGNPKGHHCQ